MLPWRPETAMARLGLEYNRTWSVPTGSIPDVVVIANVLVQPTFDDMQTVCMRFGSERVRAILDRLVQDGEIGRIATLNATRMIRNISKGLERAQGHIARGHDTAP